MKLTRRALLISNPGEAGAENYCKGVYVDLANYRGLFTSAVGGWWQPTELVVLDRPSVSQMRQEVKALAGYDYSFIGFAGHGWYSKPDGAEVLVLRKGEEISSLELRTGGGKRTIVLDCCREIHNESAIKREVRKMALAAESRRRQPIAQLCRDLFDDQVNKSSRSLVVMHSSTPPERSGDHDTDGGYYTSSVIGSADAWAEQQADNGWRIPSAALSVAAVHELGAVGTRRRSGDRQNPTIEKPRGDSTYFPFVVFA